MTLAAFLVGGVLAAAIVARCPQKSSQRRAVQTPSGDGEWFARLFDSNAAALALIDIDRGLVTRANQPFSSAMGTSDAWTRALRSDGAVEAEVTRSDGSSARVSISTVMMDTRPGEALVIVADITERWAAQHALESVRAVLETRTRELDGVISRASEAAEELQRMEECRGRADTILEEHQHAVTSLAGRLAAANRELEAFSYSVSHDLRTPLRSIDGFTKVLLDHYAPVLDDRGRDYLNRVRNATKRMSLLIDDLLKLARISKSKIQCQRVDLSVEARAVVDRLRAANPSRDVVFHADADLVIDGDPDLLRVVLENLLGNAWKFTARRTCAVITIGRREHDGSIYVRDNGAGFDMRYADALFGPFQRLHTSAEFEGNGVGLATVERIISMHGGRIFAEAVVDEGAVFHFTVGDMSRSAHHHRTQGDQVT